MLKNYPPMQLTENRISTNFSRRHIVQTAAVASLLASLPDWARAAETPVETRPIPRTGERIGIVGLGTYIVFNFGPDDAEKLAACKQVVETLIANGASVVDTAPDYIVHTQTGYGQSEARLGDIATATGKRDKLFIATKIWADDDPAIQKQTLANSLKALRVDKVDLMQLHVVDKSETSLALLNEFKAAGHTRYVGVGNSRNDEANETVLMREKPDFYQVDYSLDDRKAEARLLPAAKDIGAAVLINVPLGGRRSLFSRVKDQKLPDFASEFGAKSWAQFFLKFVLSHPAVTAAIPGTGDPAHMLDNLQAARGPMPDAQMRKRMLDYWDSLPG